MNTLREGSRRNCGDPKCPYARMKQKDLTGDTFGQLTVLGPEKDQRGSVVWRCKCGCGRETVAKAATLRSGRAESCGHPDCPHTRKKRRALDLAGRRYGSLVALRRVEDFDGRAAWLCKCDCGNEKVATAASLRSGGTRSCGCQGKGQAGDDAG